MTPTRPAPGAPPPRPEQGNTARRFEPAPGSPARAQLQQRFERLLEGKGTPSREAAPAAERQKDPARRADHAREEEAGPERSGDERRDDGAGEGRPVLSPFDPARQVLRDLQEVGHEPGDGAALPIATATLVEAAPVAQQAAAPGGPADLPQALARLADRIDAALAAGRLREGAFQVELRGLDGMVAARVERGAGAQPLAITLQLPGTDEPTKRRLMRDLARHLAERGGHPCAIRLDDLLLGRG